MVETNTSEPIRSCTTTLTTNRLSVPDSDNGLASGQLAPGPSAAPISTGEIIQKYGTFRMNKIRRTILTRSALRSCRWIGTGLFLANFIGLVYFGSCCFGNRYDNVLSGGCLFWHIIYTILSFYISVDIYKRVWTTNSYNDYFVLGLPLLFLMAVEICSLTYLLMVRLQPHNTDSNWQIYTIFGVSVVRFLSYLEILVLMSSTVAEFQTIEKFRDLTSETFKNK